MPARVVDASALGALLFGEPQAEEVAERLRNADLVAPAILQFLARSLDLTAARVNDIARERRGISADTALRLARFFNTTPDFWLNLQKSYELELAERQAGSAIKKKVKPLSKIKDYGSVTA